MRDNKSSTRMILLLAAAMAGACSGNGGVACPGEGRGQSVKPTQVLCNELPLLSHAGSAGCYGCQFAGSSQVFVSGNVESEEMILFIQGTGAVTAQWPSNLTAWNAGNDDLCGKYLLVFMDIPGYGKGLVSSPTTFSYKDYATVIDAVVAGVNRDFPAPGGRTNGKVHTVAWSFGTFVAQRWMHDTTESARGVPLGTFILFGTKSGGANYPGGPVLEGESGSYGGGAQCAFEGLQYDKKIFAVAHGKTMAALLGPISKPHACNEFHCDHLLKVCKVSDKFALSCDENTSCHTVYEQGKSVAETRDWGALKSEILTMERRLAQSFSLCTVVGPGPYEGEHADQLCRYNGPGGPPPSGFEVDGSYCDCGSTEVGRTVQTACGTGPSVAYCAPPPSPVVVVYGAEDAFILPVYQEKYASLINAPTRKISKSGHGYIVEGVPADPAQPGKTILDLLPPLRHH